MALQFRNLSPANPYQGLANTFERVGARVGSSHMAWGEAKRDTQYKQDLLDYRKKEKDTQDWNNMLNTAVNLGMKAYQFGVEQDNQTYNRALKSVQLSDAGFNLIAKDLTPEGRQKALANRTNVINAFKEGNYEEVDAGYLKGIESSDFLDPGRLTPGMLKDASSTLNNLNKDLRPQLSKMEEEYHRHYGLHLSRTDKDGVSQTIVEENIDAPGRAEFSGKMAEVDKEGFVAMFTGGKKSTDVTSSDIRSQRSFTSWVNDTYGGDRRTSLWTLDEVLMYGSSKGELPTRNTTADSTGESALTPEKAGALVMDKFKSVTGDDLPPVEGSAPEEEAPPEEIAPPKIREEAEGLNALKAKITGMTGGRATAPMRQEGKRLKQQLDQRLAKFEEDYGVAPDKWLAANPVEKTSTGFRHPVHPSRRRSVAKTSESLQQQATAGASQQLTTSPAEQARTTEEFTGLQKELGDVPEGQFEEGVGEEGVSRSRVQLVQPSADVDEEGFVSVSPYSVGAKATLKKNDDGTTTVTWRLPDGEVIGESTRKSSQSARTNAQLEASRNLADKKLAEPSGPGKFMVFEENEDGEFVNTGREASKKEVNDQFEDNAAVNDPESGFMTAYEAQFTEEPEPPQLRAPDSPPGPKSGELLRDVVQRAGDKVGDVDIRLSAPPAPGDEKTAEELFDEPITEDPLGQLDSVGEGDRDEVLEGAIEVAAQARQGNEDKLTYGVADPDVVANMETADYMEFEYKGVPDEDKEYFISKINKYTENAPSRGDAIDAFKKDAVSFYKKQYKDDADTSFITQKLEEIPLLGGALKEFSGSLDMEIMAQTHGGRAAKKMQMFLDSDEVKWDSDNKRYELNKEKVDVADVWLPPDVSAGGEGEVEMANVYREEPVDDVVGDYTGMEGSIVKALGQETERISNLMEQEQIDTMTDTTAETALRETKDRHPELVSDDLEGKFFHVTDVTLEQLQNLNNKYNEVTVGGVPTLATTKAIKETPDKVLEEGVVINKDFKSGPIPVKDVNDAVDAFVSKGKTTSQENLIQGYALQSYGVGPLNDSANIYKALIASEAKKDGDIYDPSFHRKGDGHGIIQMKESTFKDVQIYRKRAGLVRFPEEELNWDKLRTGDPETSIAALSSYVNLYIRPRIKANGKDENNPVLIAAVYKGRINLKTDKKSDDYDDVTSAFQRQLRLAQGAETDFGADKAVIKTEEKVKESAMRQVQAGSSDTSIATTWEKKADELKGKTSEGAYSGLIGEGIDWVKGAVDEYIDDYRAPWNLLKQSRFTERDSPLSEVPRSAQTHRPRLR